MSDHLLDAGLESILSMFADDPELRSDFNCLEG